MGCEKCVLFALQKSELRRVLEHVVELESQCRKHESNWMIVSECLTVIETQQSTLSEDINETLQKAQQYVRDSLDLQTRVFKMQNIGTWLNMSDFKSVSVSHLFSCM